MNRFVLDTKVWYVGKKVMIGDAKGHHQLVERVITKVGKKYVTAQFVTGFNERFRVVGQGQGPAKQMGSARMGNPLVLYTMEQIRELDYLKKIQWAILNITMGVQLLAIGDVLGVSRPEHLPKERY
jgi:hypothetical protein